MAEIPKYNLYKGLTKPLVFKGLVGKYIYIGGLGILVVLLLALILISTVGFLPALIVVVGGGGGLFGWIKKKQSGGIYDKKLDDGVLYVIPNRIKLLKREDNKTEKKV